MFLSGNSFILFSVYTCSLSSTAVKSWRQLCWGLLHTNQQKGYLLTPQCSKRGETLVLGRSCCWYHRYFIIIKVNVRMYLTLCNSFQRCISGDRFNWLFEAVVFKACLCPVAMLWWPCRGWRSTGLSHCNVVFWRQSCTLQCQGCV